MIKTAAAQTKLTRGDHARRRAQSSRDTNTKLVTLQQIEAEIGIPYRTSYALVAAGTLPGIQFPGCRRWWVKRADVERLIANSVTTTAAHKG